MSIYIVRPKLTFERLSVGLISVKLAPESREAQINAVFSARSQNPVRQDIQSWVADAESRGVTLISKNERDTPVTGTTIVKMSDSEAQRMRQELPNALVVRDRPIELIQPRRHKTKTVTADKIQVSDLWHLKAIGLEAARKQGFSGMGAGVTIAVLDTGIDPTHPELDQSVTGAYTFDLAQWKAEPMVSGHDTDGHGTHVAGLICGKKVGVAPGSKVISGVMIPHALGSLATFTLALEWAAKRPEVQIVNMSAGLAGYFPEMRTAVTGLLDVGVLPVFATGNEGRNRTRSPGNYIEPLSVGASNGQNRVASFSSGGVLVSNNHQYIVPDLVAPGEGVYSSRMGGGYEAWDGTSMATPIVSGVAALILEKYPDITVTNLVEKLLDTCQDLGQPAERQGQGLIQVKAAL
ncbi:MAG: S8 family peptidase [Ardenticatenaceae bacterium]